MGSVVTNRRPSNEQNTNYYLFLSFFLSKQNQHASITPSVFLIPASSLTASSELALQTVLNTFRLTHVYTVTEEMDGALRSLIIPLTTGCRSISEKSLKSVVLLLRETSMAMNG